MCAPGSYSMNISTERSVTSLRQAGARVRAVSVKLPRVCGWQHGGPHRVFGNHWYHARRLALITCPAVLEARRLDLGDEIRADQAPRVRVPADQRHLSNDALDSPVDGADHEYMSAAVA